MMCLIATVWAGLFAIVGAVDGLPYRYYENFSVKDDRNGSPTVEIERHTSYAHRHARVKDGRYEIVVPGNRHFFATPKLGDFKLQLGRASVRPHTWVARVGFDIYFHWDRETDSGHVLEVYHDAVRRFIVKLDGKRLFERQDPKDVNLADIWYTLDVRDGRIGELYCGKDCVARFTLSNAGSGYLGIDSTYAPSLVFDFDTVEITSRKPPAKTHVKDLTFKLRQIQGASKPLTYAVSLDRYETGETEISCTLSGTVASRGPEESVRTGGKEFGRLTEILNEPYLRLETEGREPRYLPLFNGERVLVDPQPVCGAVGKCGPWPVSQQTLVRDLPEKFTLAAGYRWFGMDPWRYLANGPYEQIQDQDGNLLYEGESLAVKAIGVRFVPPRDNLTARAIPKTAVRYEEARRHAVEGGYFRESEKVTFDIETWWRASEWEKDEAVKSVSFTDVYGEPLVGNELSVEEVSDVRVSSGFRKVTRRAALAKNPGNGVYKLFCDGRTFIFEVLSDDPNGLPPPLASGLPFFYSMPNEQKYLEQSAFDPWNPFAGASHYYAVDAQYAAIGEQLRVWELLPLYRRGWFLDVTTRNSDDVDLASPRNRELLRHARYVNGEDKYVSRMRLPVNTAWRGQQLDMLEAYLRDVKPPTKRVTLDRMAAIRKNRELSAVEIKDLFDSGWEKLVAYSAKWSAAAAVRDAEFLRSVNPAVGRCGYGPLQPYVSAYRTAYTLRFNGPVFPVEAHARDNGAFYVYEDYHHSCDYPLYRAALLLTSYDLHYGTVGRRIYPEIYTSSRSRCLDGAVFQAHPFPTGRWVKDSHQRKIVYGYVYGTPQFRNGKCRYWTDYGFHARSHELGCLEEIVTAWGKVRKNRPARSAKAPFIIDDFAQFARRGDHFDDEYNTLDCGWPFGEVDNMSEEGIAYFYEKACEAGYATPVLTDFAELDRIQPSMADYIVLPPIVPGTPKAVTDAIRRAYERGMNLLCSEDCAGLEDIFGVERLPEPRKVGYVKDEPFKHRLSVAKYAPCESKVTLFGAETGESPLDIPLVIIREGKARTAFFNVPPSCVKKNSFRYHYHFGHESVSETLRTATREVLAFLSPAPSVKSERGTITACVTEKGDLFVTVAEESPLYNDTTAYPVAFRFTVRIPGVGKSAITTDAECWSVLSRKDDELVIRIALEKDVARTFAFAGGQMGL